MSSIKPASRSKGEHQAVEPKVMFTELPDLKPARKTSVFDTMGAVLEAKGMFSPGESKTFVELFGPKKAKAHLWNIEHCASTLRTRWADESLRQIMAAGEANLHGEYPAFEMTSGENSTHQLAVTNLLMSCERSGIDEAVVDYGKIDSLVKVMSTFARINGMKPTAELLR